MPILSLVNLNSNNIIECEGASSIDEQGKYTARGKKTTRLKLSDDPRLFIATKIITKNSSWLEYLIASLGKNLGFYVEIKKDKDSTLLLNINSLAHRLHLHQDDIYKASKEGNLESLLNKQTRFIKTILTTSDQSRKLGISSPILMERNRLGNFKLNQKEIKVQGQSYFFHTNKKNQIKIAQIIQRLGAGTFGEALLVQDLTTRKEKVFKQAITVTNEKAQQDIVNEFNLLNEIHNNGKVWGIQAKPQKIVALRDLASHQTTRFGFLGKKYDENYLSYLYKTFNIPNFSAENILFEMHQLMTGLSYLEKSNILHGDLKPENILLKNINGIQLAHIADFGGARQIKNLTNNEILATTYTPSYYPTEDEKSVISFLNLGNRDKMIQVKQKSDVFALGMIMYFAISGHMPFKEDKDFRPILSTYIELSNSIPKEIQDLIKQMLHSDHNQRPSANKALKKLEDFIQNQFPGLYKKIQNLQENY